MDLDRVDTIRLAKLPTELPATEAAITSASLEPRAAAQAKAQTQALDVVFIEGFVGQTVIGIDGSEYHVPQPVRIDLAIGMPTLYACVTDSIEDTVNYAEVRAALHALLASHGVRLLEALAGKVAQLLIRDFGAHWVRVSIAKPAKFDDVEAVGVTIERRRPAIDSAGVTWAALGAGLVPN
jgi:7,8-dihydroneopterin aldolase/epimerase/oxygenase